MKNFQTDYSNIVEEEIAANEVSYSVTAEYQNINGYFITLSHFESKDLEKAENYQKLFDSEFEQFQDSLSKDEIAEGDNFNYKKFYNFADSKLELDSMSEDDLINLQ